MKRNLTTTAIRNELRQQQQRRRACSGIGTPIERTPAFGGTFVSHFFFYYYPIFLFFILWILLNYEETYSQTQDDLPSPNLPPTSFSQPPRWHTPPPSFPSPFFFYFVYHPPVLILFSLMTYISFLFSLLKYICIFFLIEEMQQCTNFSLAPECRRQKQTDHLSSIFYFIFYFYFGCCFVAAATINVVTGVAAAAAVGQAKKKNCKFKTAGPLLSFYVFLSGRGDGHFYGLLVQSTQFTNFFLSFPSCCWLLRLQRLLAVACLSQSRDSEDVFYYLTLPLTPCSLFLNNNWTRPFYRGNYWRRDFAGAAITIAPKRNLRRIFFIC